jgi:hypothetical protein
MLPLDLVPETVAQHSLCKIEWHHQVGAFLAYVSDLERRIASKLMLDSQIPLIRDSRLYLGIPDSEESA